MSACKVVTDKFKLIKSKQTDDFSEKYKWSFENDIKCNKPTMSKI